MSPDERYADIRYFASLDDMCASTLAHVDTTLLDLAPPTDSTEDKVVSLKLEPGVFELLCS